MEVFGTARFLIATLATFFWLSSCSAEADV